MRLAVKSQLFVIGELTLSITSSFSICSKKEIVDVTAEQFISCADKNLYKAKENGRDRVEQ